MKVNKTQALLYMYSILMKERYLVKQDIQAEIGINNLTFARYIQELRAFFYNFYTGLEIRYIKKDEIYILEDNR